MAHLSAPCSGSSWLTSELQDDFEEFETPDDIYEPILDQLENVADTSVSKLQELATSFCAHLAHGPGLHARSGILRI